MSITPTTTATTLSTTENTPYVFQSADFPYADPNNVPPTALKAVIIESLPTTGTIADNGFAVTAGQAVAAGDIAQGKWFTPAANSSGTPAATFSFAVQNSGGTANGGLDTSASATVTISVTAVLDASNTVPTTPVSATEGVGTAISGIAINDPDVGGNITTTLSVLNGMLTVANNVVGGLSSAGIGGNGSGSVTLTGTVAQINATLAAINGLTYLEQGDHSSDTLTVATQDKGTAFTATNTVTINVTEINDASNIVPTTPVSATEGVGMTISGIAISDPDANGNVTTTLSVLNGALTVANNVLGGLSSAGIGGHGSGSVTLTGTVAQSVRRGRQQRPHLPGAGRPRQRHVDGGDAGPGHRVHRHQHGGDQRHRDQRRQQHGADHAGECDRGRRHGDRRHRDQRSGRQRQRHHDTVGAQRRADGCEQCGRRAEQRRHRRQWQRLGHPDRHGGADQCDAGRQQRPHLPGAGRSQQRHADGGDAGPGHSVHRHQHGGDQRHRDQRRQQHGADRAGECDRGRRHSDQRHRHQRSGRQWQRHYDALGAQRHTDGGEQCGRQAERRRHRRQWQRLGHPDRHGAQINATLAASNGLTYLEQGDHSSDTLTVATQDQGTAFTATNTVAINVTEINDASNTVPTVPVSATEGVGTAISGIAISDPDANGNVTTTLSVLSGTLTVANNVLGGLSSADIGGNGSNMVTLTGTVAQINATLAASNGLTYLEQGDHSSDTLTVATQDQGTAFTATNTVAINVAAVAINHAPVTGPTTISLLENASYTFKTSDFPYSDPNNTPATVLKAVIFATLPGAGTITDNGVPIPAGQAVAAGDIAQGKLVYTPAANGFGARYATFTFAVQNSGGTANGGVDASSAATATINVAQVINKYNSSGHLISTEAIYGDGSYDVRYYTAGTFNGVAYASYDRAYTAANVLTVATYYNGSGNVVATETFTSNGGFTITLGGTLFEQKTVNADSSYDVRYIRPGRSTALPMRLMIAPIRRRMC